MVRNWISALKTPLLNLIMIFSMHKLSASSMHKLSVTMASKKETCKKKNYSEAEIDVLLMEEQMRAKTLFESLSGGVMAKAKYVAW